MLSCFLGTDSEDERQHPAISARLACPRAWHTVRLENLDRHVTVITHSSRASPMIDRPQKGTTMVTPYNTYAYNRSKYQGRSGGRGRGRG